MRIRSGVNLVHRVHKASGGLIRADFEITDRTYREVCLSGDWFCYSQDAVSVLESEIEGVGTNELRPTIDRFYAENRFETPGITIEDWMAVLKT